MHTTLLSPSIPINQITWVRTIAIYPRKASTWNSISPMSFHQIYKYLALLAIPLPVGFLVSPFLNMSSSLLAVNVSFHYIQEIQSLFQMTFVSFLKGRYRSYQKQTLSLPVLLLYHQDGKLCHVWGRDMMSQDKYSCRCCHHYSIWRSQAALIQWSPLHCNIDGPL